MIKPFQLDSLPVSHWKNGGGETREIVNIASPDAAFLWRASIATLQSDGAFSLFDGVDRVITLLVGGPLWLRGGEVNHRLLRWQPWSFAGEWPLATEGIITPGRDFNIMTQRRRATALVKVVTTAQTPALNGVAFVLQGNWELAGERYEAESGICWQYQSPGELVPLSTDATLLLAEVMLR
ncbi:HutD family protein [Scandinavium sp. V105_16]|uniref:HutD family protein n=1 Tax=Scandinavium lactucae TaxID=3095028 RepID=A0AAJ2VTV9_9ENTR|nr:MULTISPECIES: HutD family protein [unclassified Scandinavium]MDX6019823.1 HutD family protein [Scandinavium sp. V105_16]MDX6031362.1 HutD family protein [Scandinavium sp. V105_12]